MSLRWGRGLRHGLLGWLVVPAALAVGCGTVRGKHDAFQDDLAARYDGPPPSMSPPPAPAVPAPPPTLQSRKLEADAAVQRVGLPAAGSETGVVIVQPLARVNNRPILENELREAVSQQLLALQEPERSQRYKQIRKAELQKLIERELILLDLEDKLKRMRSASKDQIEEEATKEYRKRVVEIKAKVGVKTDAEFNRVLEMQNISPAGLKRQIERSYMMTMYVRNVVGPKVQAIGVDEVRRYYETHLNEFREEDRVQWLDLFTTNSRDASEAHARAQAGEDFLALVKQYDRTATTQGHGVGARRGEIMPPEAEPVLFALQPGQVGPVLQVGSGYHVVKLVSRAYAGVKLYDASTQALARKKLSAIVADREYRALIAELRRGATIDILIDEP